MIQLSEINYNYVIQIDKPVVIDFYATWCSPCNAIAPIYEKLANHYAAKASFCKCNIEESEEIARNFGIDKLPTFIVLKDGREIKRFIGIPDEKELVKLLE